MKVIGVDGCKSGWIAVVLSDRDPPRAEYLPTISALDATGAEAIAIDIPIGLPTSGRRACDVEARRALGARRSSVFFTPVRAAVDAASYASALVAAPGLSRQAFNLGTKILEVETWKPTAPACVYEVHPELSFAMLLGRPAQASKKTWAGMIERRRVLEGAGIRLEHIEGPAAANAAVDDMLDAAAAAWTAARIARRTAHSFPASPDPVGTIWA